MRVTKYTSLLIIFSSIHSIYMGNIILGISQFSIFISSILYHWKFNIKNMRYIDMSLVFSGTLLHVIFNFMYKYNYFPLLFWYFMATIMYIMGKIYDNNYLHCMLHLFAIFGNIGYNLAI